MSSPRKHRTTIFPLAVTVGLLVFFLTDGMPGGLTGLQGFFAGFGAVFVVSLVVALWPKPGRKVALPLVSEERFQNVEVGKE